MEARALSVRQPWATLIMRGLKGVESRGANTKRRGRVYVHASSTMGPAERAAAIREGLDPDALPRGVILGSVEIVDATPAAKLKLTDDERRRGDYGRGRWGWKLSAPEVLSRPIPCTGALSFWRVPAKVLAEVEAQTDQVFVYGTLKRGEGNHRLLTVGAAFVAEDKIRGRMHDLGAFPGVQLEAGDDVHGEVFKVTERTLAQLDRLEGVPTFYQRVRVTTAAGRNVWIYVMTAQRLASNRVIESGRWSWRTW